MPHQHELSDRDKLDIAGCRLERLAALCKKAPIHNAADAGIIIDLRRELKSIAAMLDSMALPPMKTWLEPLWQGPQEPISLDDLKLVNEETTPHGQGIQASTEASR